MQEADTIYAWGDIQFTDTWTPDSVTCDETAGTLTVTVTSARAGQYFRVLGTAIATETRTSYTDEGTITQRGVTQPVQASAIVYSGGAGGDGNTLADADSVRDHRDGHPNADGDHPQRDPHVHPDGDHTQRDPDPVRDHSGLEPDAF